jgi:hypothetical protein
MAFTTWGSVRGCCGHEHETYGQAETCMMADAIGCRSAGGGSDRQVREVDGDWRSYDVTRGPGYTVVRCGEPSPWPGERILCLACANERDDSDMEPLGCGSI